MLNVLGVVHLDEPPTPAELAAESRTESGLAGTWRYSEGYSLTLSEDGSFRDAMVGGSEGLPDSGTWSWDGEAGAVVVAGAEWPDGTGGPPTVRAAVVGGGREPASAGGAAPDRVLVLRVVGSGETVRLYRPRR